MPGQTRPLAEQKPELPAKLPLQIQRFLLQLGQCHFQGTAAATIGFAQLAGLARGVGQAAKVLRQRSGTVLHELALAAVEIKGT